jgi:hypothetical protein
MLTPLRVGPADIRHEPEHRADVHHRLGRKENASAGIGRFSSILFADLNLLEKRRALKLAADRASTLQSGFAATTEKPEVMAARVGNEYSEIDFSKK